MLTEFLRTRRSRVVRSLFAFAVLGACAPSAFATNYTVGIGCTYSKIQDAVNAAEMQVSGSRPIVYIASNQQYESQAIVTSAHSISFAGVADCAHLTPTGKTIIKGNGSASVFTVSGTTSGQAVGFSHLEITGGGGSSGGGIYFNGAGSMSVDNAEIDSNKATEGGGIRFLASGGAATLNINTETVISNNTATNSGGGIRVEGDATLNINADRIWIAQNEATSGQGGGVIVVAPANANIGSPGYPFGDYLPVLFENTAQYGGGLAMVAATDSDGSVKVLATDKAHPVLIGQNRAYHAGGGIYVKPNQTFNDAGFASVELGGVHVDGNIAAEGSGIYSDTESSAGLTIGGIVSILPGYCNTKLECNTVSDNIAEDQTNTPTAGSAILLQTLSSFSASQFAMRGNQGAHAIRVADQMAGPPLLDTCLIANNTVTGELVTFGNASASVSQCTLADNAISGPSVFYAEASFSLRNSIVAQGTLTTLHYNGSLGNTTLDYVMSKETSSLSAGTHIINADPAFVDAAHDDYHLGPTSPAIDVAPASISSPTDLDGLPRDQDIPNVGIGGVRDLGAYERQLTCGASDTIFCDGFQSP